MKMLIIINLYKHKNKTNMKQILFFFVIVILLLTNTPISHAIQKGSYLMPFRSSEYWDTNAINGRDNYGIHKDRTGFSIDFYSPLGSTRDILAPSNGVITKGCSVGDNTLVYFNSEFGDKFRFIHMQASSLIIGDGQSRNVNRGDYIGKISSEVGTFNSSTCFLSSEAPQLHFGWESTACPFYIDGYTFSCDDMRLCPGTYAVDCNKKYLNTEFISSNKTGLTEETCKIIINEDYLLGETGDRVNNLQICLNRLNLYGENIKYTNKLDDFTYQQLKIIKNTIKSKPVTSVYNTNLVLDIPYNSSADQTTLWVHQLNGTEAQKFFYDNTTNQIRWKDKCLDGGNGTENQKVRIAFCKNSKTQQWVYDSSSRIINVQNSLCIDSQYGVATYANVILYSCHNDNNQKWANIIGINTGEIQTNTIVDNSKNFINLKLNESYTLDIPYINNTDQQKLWLHPVNGSNAQKFSFNKLTNQILWNDKCIDSSINLPVKLVKIAICSESKSQKWKFDSKSRIVNLANNLCIEAETGIKKYTNIVLNNCNNADNQKWNNFVGIENVQIIANKAGQITSQSQNSFSIDIPYIKNVNQQALWLHPVNSSDAQVFSYDFESKQIKWKDKCLDTITGSNNQPVRIVYCNNSKTQQWKYDSNSRIVNLSQNLCLDSQFGLKTYNNIIIHTCHNDPNQKWTNNIF
jgi:hypothetical protein